MFVPDEFVFVEDFVEAECLMDFGVGSPDAGGLVEFVLEDVPRCGERRCRCLSWR